MTIEIDRRAFPRQAPASRETYVWIADMAAQKAIMARLLNIGSGGALVETHALAPTDRVLQVGLVNAPDVGWLEAIIVRFEHTNRIALRFDPRASLDFISAAISGSKPTRDGAQGEAPVQSGAVEALSESTDTGNWTRFTGQNHGTVAET